MAGTSLRANARPPAVCEVAGAFVGESLIVVPERSQFRAVPIRLLQVISDDLFILFDGVPGLRLQPAGEAEVQLRTRVFGDAAVRGVPDEDVTEGEPILSRELRSLRVDERSPNESLEMGADERPVLIGGEFRYRSP